MALRQSKTFHTIAIYATGNMVAMVLGVVGSLVQAHYVGPDDMGIFRTFSIITGYLTFLHLGVFDGLHREIPLQLGRGNPKKAEQIAAACLAWIVFISVSSGLLFLGLAVHAAFSSNWAGFWGWLSFVPVIVGTFYGGYLAATFRTGQQFTRLSKAAVMQAIAGTLVLPLMPRLGYYAVCLRMAASSATNLLFLHRWRPLRVRPCVDWPNFRGVIRIGLPMSGIGYIYTSLWISLEGTFILEWFGVKSLGLYGMAAFIRTVVVQLAQNMNQVLDVKIYEQYGRTGEIEDCLKRILTPMLLAFFASFPAIVIGWYALPYVVNLLIPKYIEAIPIMRVILFAMPITFLILPITILWAIGTKFYCFASVVIGFLTFVGVSYLLRSLNFGVSGVLIASMLGQLMYIFSAYCLIYKLSLRTKAVATAEE